MLNVPNIFVRFHATSHEIPEGLKFLSFEVIYLIQSRSLKDLDMFGNKAFWRSAVSGLDWMNTGSEFMVDAT